MMIGVVGLGLIGGSMAKALNENTDYTVYGFDIDDTVCKGAKLVNAIEDYLSPELIPQCDVVIVALYPQKTIDFIKANKDNFKKDALVIDCCGVKENVCRECFEIAKDADFTFIGGHPMAGVEHSGFAYAKKAMFDKASMVLVPPKGLPIETLETAKRIFTSIGFTNVQISTAEEHDEIIAFTSQLAHVVSGAYIKSPTATSHSGFSAGSYKDMTRVAKLNEAMWTELFLENADNLSNEIEHIIEKLNEVNDAIKNREADKLCEILRDGRIAKERIDNERF